MKKYHLIIIAHNNLGSSLSGGDQIFLNLIKHAPTTIKTILVGSQESQQLLHRYHISPNSIYISAPKNQIALSTTNLLLHQIIRIFFSFYFFFSHLSIFKTATQIYTASDFPSDSVFGILTKIFYPKVFWIAGFYLFAPNPFNKNSPYTKTHRFFRGLIYYIGQFPIYFFVKLLAHTICLTSKLDTLKFPNKNCIVIQGGVYIPKLNSYRLSSKYIPTHQRKFDAVYLGRLHFQKGILELIDIWRIVVSVLPQAILAIIGDGELKEKLINKINRYHLEKNVHLFGFKTGQKKYLILQNSKIVVHPATYDSGGMAAAEAMAFGLPGVSFNLEALKTYYPQGMLKTPCFSHQQFAQNIINLLTDSKLYQKTSHQATNLIVKHWNWSQRLDPIYQTITSTP